MAKNLFVGNLPYSVTDDALGQLFAQFGQVQTVNVIKDRYTGSSRGFAFVEMTTEEEAQKAIEKLNGYNLEGRAMVVKEALPKPTSPRFGGGGGRDDRHHGGDRGGGGFRRGGGRDRRY